MSGAQPPAFDAIYRAIFAGSADAILVAEPGGYYVDCNPAAEALTGYTRAELLTQRMGSFVLDDAGQIIDRLDRIRRTGSITSEFDIRRKDGTIITVEAHSSIVQLPPEEETSSREALIDVWKINTERSAPDEALRAAESRFQTLVEQLPAVTYITGPLPDTRLLYVSPQLESLLGYMPEEWIGQSFALNVHTHPDDLPRIVEADARAFASVKPFKEEFRMIRRDGRVIWVMDSSTPILDERGEARQWQGVLTDITALKTAEEELRRSQERFQAFMDNSPTIAIIKDEAGRYVYLSPPAERVLGLPISELLGKADGDWMPQESVRLLRESDTRILATGKPETLVQVLPDRDGGATHWLTTRFPLIDPAGQRFICAVAVDITERQRLGEQLHYSQALFQAVMDNSPSMVAVRDEQGRFVFINDAMERFFGIRAEHIVGRDEMGFFPPELAQRIRESDARILATGQSEELLSHIITPSGADIHWLAIRFPLTDSAGERFICAIAVDVTEQKRLELELRHSQHLFQAFMDNSPSIAFIKDEDGRYLFASSAIRRQYPFGPEGVVGKTAAEWMRPDLQQEFAESDERILATGKPDEVLVVTEAGTGNEEHWLNIRFPLTEPSGKRLICGIAVNITDRLRLEDELRRSQERFQAFMDNSPTAAWIADAMGRLIYISLPGPRNYGYRAEQMLGKTWSEWLLPDIARLFIESDERVRETGRPESFTTSLPLADGEDSTWLLIRFPLTDVDGQVLLCGVGIDITERFLLEEELRRQAVTDSLTALPNRPLFTDRLAQALLRTRSSDHRVAVLFIDLDHFKHVNDSLGHAAGDLLLTEVVDRLSACLQPTDVLARIGGDEFAVLVDAESTSTEVYAMAERLIASLRPPFNLEGAEAFIGASIGISFAGDRHHDAGNLLREADIALYEAKGAGRGRAATFEESMNARAFQRLELETALRHAVERNELTIGYQPIVDLANGVPHGCEALVRWNHPERGLLTPADFLELAEETGSIVPVGEWVLETACRAAATWPPNVAGVAPYVAVNVSARQLRDAAFGSTLWRVLAETGLPPGRLMLEVTETALIEDEDAATQFLITLRRLGVRLALDDFGKGYSSLGQLHRLQLEELKLDQSLVTGLGIDRHSIAIVRAVTELARELALTVTAEGIETPDQHRLAKELGCHRGQGFHFSGPLPPEEIDGFLAGGGNGKVVRLRRGS